MNFRLTLGLLIVLVIVGVAVYWSELRPEAAPVTPTPAVTKVFSFEPKDVTDLAVAWSGKQVALHQASAGQWQLTQPEAAPADSYEVSGILGQLGTLSASRQLTVKSDELASYGLNPPQGAITVTLVTGSQLRQTIGSQTVDKGSYYTRRPTTDTEATVNIVPATTIEGLQELVANPPKAAPTPTAAPAASPTP